ncbi:MAG: type VI secretion system tube protein TssD, partial [Bacteroidota bacterium]
THAPISLSCKVGKATPLYLQALTNNERLAKVKIDFYHTDETGMEVLFYSIELENATFADISMSSDGGGSFDVASYSLAYQKIIWTWADGNVTTEDDWLTPT